MNILLYSTFNQVIMFKHFVSVIILLLLPADKNKKPNVTFSDNPLIFFSQTFSLCHSIPELSVMRE